MKLQINITQDVLNKTKNCNGLETDVSTSCAIAEAIREIFPDARVSPDMIRFTRPVSKGSISHYRTEEIILPPAAVLFIKQFDKALPHERVRMKPFSFDIIVPDSLIEEVDISEIEQILQSSKTIQYGSIQATRKLVCSQN